MPWKFNPFSGTLDQTGAGGGASYIDGEVATYNDLPLDGTAALNTAWLVRSASGSWLTGRKPAGIYIRTATAGSSRDADYTYAGIFPDVFSDANFTLYDDADSTKNVKFQLSGIATGTTRTISVPNANVTLPNQGTSTFDDVVFNSLQTDDNLTVNGDLLVSNAISTGISGININNATSQTALTTNATTVRSVSLPDSSGTLALTSDFAAPPAIGSTTRNTGAFTTLNANNGTLTASAPVLDLSQTWNNAAVTFTGLRLNVTNTASASASTLADLQVGGASMFSVTRTGSMVAGASAFSVNGSSGNTGLWNGGAFGWTSSATATASIALDTSLFRDAADTIAQRRDTNPQTFRIYNTFTDASNYERGFISWVSNTLRIGTEKAGTGSARALEFQTDGTTRLTIAATGNTTFAQASVVGATWYFGHQNRSIFKSPSDGVLTLMNWAETDFGRLQFGGTTSSFPALKRSSTTLQVRLADDSAFAPLSCGALTLNGNLDASTRDIVTDTTTGTKIGTGTTQKLGFFNATPIVRPAAIADATDAATTQARLNDLLAAMRSLGLIAT